ncbi:rhodanese-like domain-containing protein [Brevibacillus daliensis]|uniref:rhodanese-like domain-containing protein n=1 Tax=Brevibacillus daliensis TaxID=2892995 RepID=UPI001E32581C|nr:rhodanese-like domain-containing protein [Brevibacillus daliensis]
MHSGWQNITPNELENKMAKENELQLIDVRTPEEYAEERMEGAISIPLHELPNRIHELNPTKNLYMICRSGNRSGQACEFLASLGYKNLYNMVGGMMNWHGKVE